MTATIPGACPRPPGLSDTAEVPDGQVAPGAGISGRSLVTMNHRAAMSRRLTPETAAELLSRFHDFDDGVVIDVHLSFGDSRSDHCAGVTVQAMDHLAGFRWHDVTFTLAGLREYRLPENGRQFHRVLSDGLAILWNDDGTVTLDIENLGRGEESDWFLRATSCDWSERKSP